MVVEQGHVSEFFHSPLDGRKYFEEHQTEYYNKLI